MLRLRNRQDHLVETTQVRRNERTEARIALRLLSSRELEVLGLIAEGYSTKEIGARLGITFKTAVTHRTRILRKLQVHESASLVRLAVRAGLVHA